MFTAISQKRNNDSRTSERERENRLFLASAYGVIAEREHDVRDVHDSRRSNPAVRHQHENAALEAGAFHTMALREAEEEKQRMREERREREQKEKERFVALKRKEREDTTHSTPAPGSSNARRLTRSMSRGSMTDVLGSGAGRAPGISKKNTGKKSALGHFFEKAKQGIHSLETTLGLVAVPAGEQITPRGTKFTGGRKDDDDDSF